MTERSSRLPSPASRLPVLAQIGFAIFWAAVPVAAETNTPSVKQVFDSLESVRHFHDVAISRDGRSVAWSERARDAKGQDQLGRVFVATPGASKPRRLTGAVGGKDAKEKGAAFSPDGSRVAFLSDAGTPGKTQIWVASVKAGAAAPRKLTRVKGQLDHLRWSPDGRSIAFLFVEGSEQETGALVAHKRDSGVVSEDPEIQRIAVADAATGAVRTVSPEKLYVYDYDWAPDGRSFAAEAAVGSGTDNYWLAQLYVVDAATGAERSIWKPPLQIAWPRFSPDGKWIAVIHGIMSDEGSDGGDVWVVPAAGGEARNLTPGMPATAKTIAWRADGSVQFGENVDGEGGVARVEPGAGKIETLWKGPQAISKLECAPEGTCAAALDSFSQPPEVYAGAPGSWKAVTSINAGAKTFWGEAKSLHWKSDGASVQGWLLPPRDADPAAKHPMVVIAHGGPSGVSASGWPSRWTAVLPSQGYYVFLPNPRGSFGFGEAFAAGNVKDFGGGDLRDILSGIDEVLRQAPVDPARLGITGWSYGGYMAMWAVTQTDRFAAAVAGAGIASWQSYYGQNKIDTWMLPFFGASVYEDPKVYAKSSPIEFIRNVKTPTLVLHGERDSEVPTPQGYEFWHALKTLGVPTELVIYTDEGHSVRDPKHQLDIQERTVAWFDRYLKNRPVSR